MTQDNKITVDYILHNEINPSEAVKYLDEMFLGWLGSSRCSDSECSNEDRSEIGAYYQRMKEIFIMLKETQNKQTKWFCYESDYHPEQ